MAGQDQLLLVKALDSTDRDESSFLDMPGLRLDAFAEHSGNSQK
jgi:hypothetical protein